MVGVAHYAGVVSKWIDDDVISFGNGGMAAGGIHSAAVHGANVIVIAFGSTEYQETVAWEIQDHFHQGDVVFVGAAGTGWNRQTPVFPASMPEVIAVTGSNHDGSRPDVADIGNKYQAVVAYTNLVTHKLNSLEYVALEGSSGATGFLGGVAALVRARNPTRGRFWVIDRIVRTSGIICGGPDLIWRPAMINASAAVGGPCVAPIGMYVGMVYTGGNPLSTFAVARVMQRFPDGYVPGGSGNYSTQWVFPAGAAPDGPQTVINGEVEVNGVYWRYDQPFIVQPAYDGQPYLLKFSVSVFDNQLGTVDTREYKLRVCHSPSTCWSTNRDYPIPAGLGITISGPNAVPQPGTQTWYSSVTGTSESYSVSWDISYDGGESWSHQNTGSEYSREFYTAEGPYSMMIRATVTTASGQIQEASQPVYVDTRCGPNIC